MLGHYWILNGQILDQNAEVSLLHLQHPPKTNPRVITQSDA